MSLFGSSPVDISLDTCINQESMSNDLLLSDDDAVDLLDFDDRTCGEEDDLLFDLVVDEIQTADVGQRSTLDDSSNYSTGSAVSEDRMSCYLQAHSGPNREHVRRSINEVLDLLNDQMSRGDSLCFTLPVAASPQASTEVGRTFTFPGNSVEDSWRFSVVLKIMDQVKEAVGTGSVVSKRDVYYHDPALFGSQATVDRHIDLIAAALGVKRSELNVCAAAKGLIAGAAEFHYKDGTIHKLFDETVPRLIGSSDELLAVSMEEVSIIMVVEKEASFQDLLMTVTWHDVKDRAIVLTGKGYPDLATRRLLHLLAHPSPFNHFASPPVYLLTDFDPDGIAIAQTYKHGSLKFQHEGQGIQTPRAQRLGLSRKHVADLPGPSGSQTLLSMTVRDRRKAQNMLKRMVDHEDMTEDMVDLQFMLMMNVKAELQSLNEGQGGLDQVLAAVIMEERT